MVEAIEVAVPKLSAEALVPIVVEKSELVATSNPAGGVTVTAAVPFKALPVTVKLVGLSDAVPYVVLTADKVPEVEIVGEATNVPPKVKSP